MNYADIKYPDIQDGTGIRLAIYVSGCHFHCKNCHNKEAWDPNFGEQFTDEILEKLLNKFEENKEYNDGLSLLGGEPLEPYNQEGLLKLTNEFKKRFPDKDIWCWTGYDFDKDILNKMYKESNITKELISNIDIIVDGTYEDDKKIVDLIARGSYNQKKIDVKASINSGKTVVLKFGDESRYETKNPKVIVAKEFIKNFSNENNLKAIPNNVLVDQEIQISEPDENVFTIKKTVEKISADNIKIDLGKEE